MVLEESFVSVLLPQHIPSEHGGLKPVSSMAEQVAPSKSLTSGAARGADGATISLGVFLNKYSGSVLALGQ